MDASCNIIADLPQRAAHMTETARPEDLLTRVGLFAALGRVELAKLAAYLDSVDLPPAPRCSVRATAATASTSWPRARWAFSWRRPTGGPAAGGHAHAGRSFRRDGPVHRRAALGDDRAERPSTDPAIAPRALPGPGGPRAHHLADHRRHAEPAAALGQRGARRARRLRRHRARGGAAPASRRAPRRRARGEPARHSGRRAAAGPVRCRGRHGRGRSAEPRRGRKRSRPPRCACCASGSSTSSDATGSPRGPRRRGPAGGGRSVARRARRAGPRLDPDRLRATRWRAPCGRSPRSTPSTRCAGSSASRTSTRSLDGDLALTRAALHESRGDSGPGAGRPPTRPRRRAGGGRPGDRTTAVDGDRTALDAGRTSDSSADARPAERAAPRRRRPPIVSVGVAGLCIALAAWPGRQSPVGVRVAAARRHHPDDEPGRARVRRRAHADHRLGAARGRADRLGARGLRLQGVALRRRDLRSGRGHRTLGAALPHRPAPRAPTAARRAVADGDAAGDGRRPHAPGALEHRAAPRSPRRWRWPWPKPCACPSADARPPCWASARGSALDR